MIHRIRDLINKEDKKNPYTDEEISEILKVDREVVTKFRLENDIPNSRERRQGILKKDLKEIVDENKDISIRQLTKRLNDMGYNISRHIVENTKYEIYGEDSMVEKVSDSVPMSFSKLIGSEGSLKIQVSQAKASVLYPPNGLHTMILGASGTGKTQLAEAMYYYGLESKTFEKDAPFIVFNCADYADNPQLLLSQLFGHIKGAFTGADVEKEGLVEKANGGILFLDEVHRLPSEGQEILFYLLDKGRFRRLGEVDNYREANIMLIAATTEDPESSLLITFRRRIPMIIKMPALRDRPLEERYKLVNTFFLEESSRVKKEIRVKPEVIKYLMIYDCPGNIGQLKSDVQVACARGFLNSKMNKLDYILVNKQDLLSHTKSNIQKGLGPDIHDIRLEKELIFDPKGQGNIVLKQDEYTPVRNMYQFIEDRYLDLNNSGLDEKEINNIVGKELEAEINDFVQSLKYKDHISKEELKSIVDKEILDISEDIYKIANEHFENLKANFYYCISVHLNSTMERIKQNKKIVNPRLENVKREYVKEFKVAEKIVDRINEKIGIQLPEDEIGFIAMYLNLFSGENEIKEGKIKIIVMSHGYVASAMADVANKLLGVDHAIGIEMDLNESYESIVERTVDLVEKVDEGKGCIFLVDMGSLARIDEVVTERTGIPTRVVDRVDTVMVLEAVRRAILPSQDMDEIVWELVSSKGLSKENKYIPSRNNKKKAIVTVCITGEGTALSIKQLLESKGDKELLKNIEIIPIGLFSEEQLEIQIERIKKENEIIAYVGTIEPPVNDRIPFINMTEVIKEGGIEKINDIILSNHDICPVKYENIVNEELVLFDLDAYTKNEVIDSLFLLLKGKGFVKEEFLLDVYKRESLRPTTAKGGIAIPHGMPNNVLKPGFAIAKLKKPVEWEKNMTVDLVFMIAYKTDSKDFFKILYNILLNQEYLIEFKSASNASEIADLINKDMALEY